MSKNEMWLIHIFNVVKLPLLLVWLFPVSIFCQNLVPNPGFESNEQLDANTPTITDEFKYVSKWHLLGWQSFYCHCKTHDPQNWYVSACRKHLYQPRTGCAMIKMVYEESSRTDTDLHTKVEYNGAASYLECKLNEPLEVGSVYEMSFWVYFPKDTIVEKSILTHIGFLPTLHFVSMRSQSLLYMKRFFSDSIQMGEWFQIKKYIRALCPLEYIVIGAFQNNSFPLIHRYIWNYPFYFIDDVRVQKVNSDSIENEIIPTPFCKFYEDEEVRLEVPTEKQITLYFETGSNQLPGDQLARLDSFISAVDPRWQPVYSILGHTDNTGNENDQLSQERSLNVKDALMKKHSISEFRMILFGAGSNKPVESNENEKGRSQNRRVEIQVTSLHKQAGLYRYCMELVQQEEYVMAREFLKKWIAVSEAYEVIYILFDYRFDAFKTTKEWKEIVGLIKNKYSKVYSSTNAFYLDSLRCEDQRYRTLEMAILSLSGFFKDYEDFEFERYTCDIQKLDSTDASNLKSLLTYLQNESFPRISEAGRRNVQGMIYILIHSEDTVLLNKYLPLIEERCLQGEAEWNGYAMMFDRNLLLKGLPQHYGTQSVMNDSKTEMSLAPIEDLDLVNQRRIKIGLAPISPEQASEKQKVIFTRGRR